MSGTGTMIQLLILLILTPDSESSVGTVHLSAAGNSLHFLPKESWTRRPSRLLMPVPLLKHSEWELQKKRSPWWYSHTFSPESSGHPRWAFTSGWCYRSPWETTSLSCNYRKVHDFLEEHISEPEKRAREVLGNWYCVDHLNIPSAILLSRNAPMVRGRMQDNTHKPFTLVS